MAGEKPALKRLFAGIESGDIDCVVAYKVDRRSRSLLDLARMMELFDKHAVSYVAVTQQFNTVSSMGRLILSILLSFAQFEREIISKRTRDKMSATRRTGKWVGGMPVLGYDVDPKGGKLIVNEDEAAQVRGDTPEEKAASFLDALIKNGLAQVQDDKPTRIPIPAIVWQGIDAVRLSGQTNMLDRPVVARLAGELGWSDAARWIEEHPKGYAEGVFRGFVVDPQGGKP
ncbi:recombinase family protein [Desulfatirhabdium butyrativorans]|uniref:recombinase family protein n=1 Tax=Desulfatirhabdium butyrativorans TaxID=340467 RepID=UPI0004012CA3|nr:recombinase family protein [Desulfatirhabdium butyrativorans]